MKIYKKQQFDYGDLSEQDVRRCERASKQVRYRQRRIVGDIIVIGQQLIEVKECLGHGMFRTWIRHHFGWEKSTANRLMQAARLADQCPNIGTFNVEPSALYLLAAPSCPQDVLDSIVSDAEAGERITHKYVKARIDEDAANGRALASQKRRIVTVAEGKASEPEGKASVPDEQDEPEEELEEEPEDEEELEEEELESADEALALFLRIAPLPNAYERCKLAKRLLRMDDDNAFADRHRWNYDAMHNKVNRVLFPDIPYFTGIIEEFPDEEIWKEHRYDYRNMVALYNEANRRPRLNRLPEKEFKCCQCGIAKTQKVLPKGWLRLWRDGRGEDAEECVICSEECQAKTFKSKYKLSRGKHAGQRLSKVPIDYLEWIHENKKSGELYLAAVHELPRRRQTS